VETYSYAILGCNTLYIGRYVSRFWNNPVLMVAEIPGYSCTEHKEFGHQNTVILTIALVRPPNIK